MATREEIKKIMYIIANEYPAFIPNNESMLNIKIETWSVMLKDFDFTELKQATLQMLSTFEYGTPKIANLMTILNPPMKDQNQGAEFATRLIDLSSKYGTDKIGQKIIDEFGQIGYSVYRQVKKELRVLTYEDANTFKAQVRTLYNSYKERERHDKLDKLPYNKEAQKLINNDAEKLAATKQLGKSDETF